jgi:hypothetical protein
MQHPLQTYKIYIFSKLGKGYVMRWYPSLNKVYSHPHVIFHGDWTYRPTIYAKNMKLGCYIIFGTLKIY